MNYPIFNSIVKQIESELSNRSTKIANFRLWEEEAINATGLEFIIDLSKDTHQIKNVSINLDWDKFREARLAKQLKGMEKHPLANLPRISNAKVIPTIDVEIIWHFNEKAILVNARSFTGNQRIETASSWMDNINKEINASLPTDNMITRWHVEIEGDLKGKYLSNMSLISYLQYPLADSRSLNKIHQFVAEKIQQLLVRTNKVMQIAESTLKQVA
ncbi:MAG: hypothetical protein WD038_09660 [Balneolales bacterium]